MKLDKLVDANGLLVCVHLQCLDGNEVNWEAVPDVEEQLTGFGVQFEALDSAGEKWQKMDECTAGRFQRFAIAMNIQINSMEKWLHSVQKSEYSGVKIAEVFKYNSLSKIN
jgi:hypothetical protein